MKQSRRLLAEAIGSKTLDHADLKSVAIEVAAYLLEEGRVAELEPLMRDIIAYRADHGMVEADVESAHQLDERAINDVKDILKEYYPDAKQITVSTRVNPEVIGGIRVTMPHQQLDLTVRSKLSAFTHKVMI